MGLLEEVAKTNRPILGGDIPILVFRVFRHFSATYVEEVLGRGAAVVFQNGGRDLGREAGSTRRRTSRPCASSCATRGSGSSSRGR